MILWQQKVSLDKKKTKNDHDDLPTIKMMRVLIIRLLFTIINSLNTFPKLLKKQFMRKMSRVEINKGIVTQIFEWKRWLHATAEVHFLINV